MVLIYRIANFIYWETVDVEPTISRRELSQRVCERQNWLFPNGKLKDMSCRKALSELNKRCVIRVPAVSETYAFNHPAESMFRVDVPEISCSLAELGMVTIEPIMSRYSHESKVWRSLVETHHYLGIQGLCAAQMRYLVVSSTFAPLEPWPLLLLAGH